MKTVLSAASSERKRSKRIAARVEFAWFVANRPDNGNILRAPRNFRHLAESVQKSVRANAA
jgi:hypothetical protein